jgi:two-component system sensor histidine kinase CpxA
VRTLFMRVFLTLFLVMAAVTTVLIFSSPMLTRSRPGIERWQRSAEEFLSSRVRSTASRIAGGRYDWRRDNEDHGGGHGPPRPWVLAADGTVVEGSEPPEEVIAIAKKAAASGDDEWQRSGSMHIFGRPVAAPDGTRYVVVAVARRPPSSYDLLEPKALGWRLGVLGLIVGGLSLWLARGLSSPVAKLRHTVRRLADGELSARVEPTVVRRRDEVGDLARDFNAMATRLEALLAAQRRLVSDVSHELRSPLARLEVALELARQRCDHGAAELLDRIGHESERLDTMIGQLLELSRLDSADRPRREEPVDLAELAGALAEDAAFEASARAVAVKSESAGDTTVRGDMESLASAVENVLRNAIRYTDSGSEVSLTVGAEGDQVAVRIADRGPGVPEAQLESVFEPFFRVEEARERGAGGSGLGLAITKRIVRLHSGSVTAANRPEGGLEVTIRLPRAGASGAPRTAALQVRRGLPTP